MIFSKYKLHYIKLRIVVVILILTTSCQPKTTEELVSELKNSESVEESKKIAYEIAAIYDINAVALIKNKYADYIFLIEYSFTT